MIDRKAGAAALRGDVKAAGVARPTAAAPASAARGRQNDTVVVSVTSRGSPTATIRLLLLDG